LSRPGETVVENGVKIIAPLNLPSTMATDASILWSRNLSNFLLAFWKEKAFVLDMEDEIMRGATITHKNAIVHPWVKEAVASARP
jgi:NAD/NADP transhydrogenase alpha subunit